MGLLKGRIEDYSSPLVGVPVRMYAGYFFLKYGLEKATRGFGDAELHETLAKWAAGQAYDFYVPFLQRIAIPHAGLFAHLVAYGELAVGVLLLAGCVTRLAALGGIFLCLNFLFASGVPIVSVEMPSVFLLLLLTVYLTAPGRVLGVDGLLKQRVPSWVA
jgi:thiosulfate dehydrogenase (quinone) large subunit